MEKRLKIATVLANLLDNQFRLFGRSFGFNSILALIPGIGDLIPTIFALYIVAIGIQLNVPKHKVFEMFWNVFLNFLVRLFPLLGDLIFFFHKANLKNLAIIKQYAKHPELKTA